VRAPDELATKTHGRRDRFRREGHYLEVNHRRLLLSLLAVPACGPQVDGDDPTVPDGGDPEKLGSSCRSYYGRFFACYEAHYTEDYDVDGMAERYCQEIETELLNYGPGCLAAYEEVFACLASLDCEELLGGDEAESRVAQPCVDVYIDASGRCPELLSLCGVVGVGFGDEMSGSCSLELAGCLDGKDYAVRCSGEGDAQTCACEVDGATAQTVMLPAANGCQGTFIDDAIEACGFPDNLV
jgi:hypothetical protein